MGGNDMSITCANCGKSNPPVKCASNFLDDRKDPINCVNCGQKLFEECPVCNSQSVLGGVDEKHSILRGSNFCPLTGKNIAETNKKIEAVLVVQIAEEDRQRGARELSEARQKLLETLEAINIFRDVSAKKKEDFLDQLKKKHFEIKHGKFLRKRGYWSLLAIVIFFIVVGMYDSNLFANLLLIATLIFISLAAPHPKKLPFKLGALIFGRKLWREFSETYRDPPDEKLENMGFR